MEELWLWCEPEPPHGILSRGFHIPEAWHTLISPELLAAWLHPEIKGSIGSCSLSRVKGRVAPNHFIYIFNDMRDLCSPCYADGTYVTHRCQHRRRRWAQTLESSTSLGDNEQEQLVLSSSNFSVPGRFCEGRSLSKSERRNCSALLGIGSRLNISNNTCIKLFHWAGEVLAQGHLFPVLNKIT